MRQGPQPSLEDWALLREATSNWLRGGLWTEDMKTTVWISSEATGGRASLPLVNFFLFPPVHAWSFCTWRDCFPVYKCSQVLTAAAAMAFQGARGTKPESGA